MSKLFWEEDTDANVVARDAAVRDLAKGAGVRRAWVVVVVVARGSWRESSLTDRHSYAHNRNTSTDIRKSRTLPRSSDLIELASLFSLVTCAHAVDV